jgi:dimethylargininase
MRTALVRRPGPRLADGLVTHIKRVAIDEPLARRQWLGVVLKVEGCVTCLSVRIRVPLH